MVETVPMYLKGGKIEEVQRVPVRISGEPEQLAPYMHRLGAYDAYTDALTKITQVPGPFDEIEGLLGSLEGPDYQWWKLNRAGQKVAGDGQETIEDANASSTAANIAGLLWKPLFGFFRGLISSGQNAKKEADGIISDLYKRTEGANLIARQAYASLRPSQQRQFVNGLLPGLRNYYGYP